MSRAQQPSILSFFQPNNKQQPPKYAAPPISQAQQQQQPPPLQQVPPPAPPPPPPSQQPVAPVISALPVTALPPSTPCPHPSATIVPVTDAHIPALRRINALLLPVNYTDSFYKAILDPAQSGLFSRAILFRDGDASSAPKVVGGLVCRLEPSPFDPASGAYSCDLARRARERVSPPDSRVLYVQSLGVLAPYRGLGLAAAAVEGMFDAVRAVEADARGNGLNIGWIYAHVWTENHDALGWYARRGFERDVRLENYYFKLQPGSAWVMKRRVLPSGAGEGREMSGGMRNWGPTNGHATHQPSPIPATVTTAAVNLPGFSSASGMATPPPATAPNGPQPPAARPGPPGSSLSFQNKRPDMEWNDLPEDMVAAARTTSRTKDLLSPPTGSGSSSRSSSAAGRKKKDRAYPTAAFGK